MDFIQELDMNIVSYIHDNWHNIITDRFFTFITYISDGGIVWLTAAFIMLFFRKWRPVGVIMLLSLGISAVLTSFVIKYIVCRPRPFNVDPMLKLIIDVPSGVYSFPSGHSTASGAGAAVITMKSRRLGIPALIVALLVGFSRVFMAVHYPTDVLCGLALGAVCSAVIWHYLYSPAEKLLDKLPPKKTKQ